MQACHNSFNTCAIAILASNVESSKTFPPRAGKTEAIPVWSTPNLKNSTQTNGTVVEIEGCIFVINWTHLSSQVIAISILGPEPVDLESKLILKLLATVPSVDDEKDPRRASYCTDIAWSVDG
jgi:hypothetical protein